MEKEEIILDVITTLHNYYEKQESFRKTFPDQPAITKAIEIFDVEMDEMIDSVLDLIEVPSEETNERYNKINWTRGVCTNLIKNAAKYPEFKQPAAEMILDWKNLEAYTSRVDKHTWFHYTELLEEHLTGYKKWHEKQREENKNDKKA